MARTHKNSLSTVAGRQQRIHGLTEAARQIGREQAQTEELSNYFEVLTFFKNPPESESDRVIPKGSKKPQ
jgi:hypothetical protein